MEKEEYQGYIRKIDKERNYGFIHSDKNGIDYYFKPKYCKYQLKLNDPVAFLGEIVEESCNASAIRKIYVNKCGIKFVPRIDIHHIHVNLDVNLPFVIDTITDLNEENVEKETKLPNITGISECVPTDGTDQIIYAIRGKRLGHSRLVLNREGIDTNFIFTALLRLETHYLIKTIYFGRKAAREPFDALATQDDLRFWDNHALIFHKDEILEGSETKSFSYELNTPSICRLKTNPGKHKVPA